MAQGQISKGDSEVQKSPVEKKKEKDHTPSKVVIRRLPPTLTPEDFVQQVSPLPEYDFFYFVRADMSLGANAFTRAYINFLVPDDIFIFRDKFDGYVFLDSKGGEYPALVEFAPFQKVPKKKPKKVDAKNGIIEQDSDYKKFLENLSKPTEAPPVSLDAMVVEVEAKENIITKSGLLKMSTPLLDYLRKRREERKLNIAKLKEERRRGGGGGGGGGRDRDDRKRSGKDDLDRRKSSEKDRVRDRDRDRHRDRNRERDRLRERDRRRDKDSHRSERNKENKDDEKKWHKDGDRTPKTVLRNTERDSQNQDKGGPEKATPQEREKRDNEKDGAQDRLSEADLGKGTRERKSEDIRGKRGLGGGGGKWGEDRRRDDDRDRRGSRGRGMGSDDGGKPYKEGRAYQGYRDDLDSRLQDKDKNRGGGDRYEKVGDRYDKERVNDRYDKERVNDRYDKERANDRYDKERGGDRYDKERGNDRYDKERGGDRYDKERSGYNSKYRDDRYNYRDKYRDDRGGSGRYRDEQRGGDKDDRRGGVDRERKGVGEREERKGKGDRDERRNDRDDRRAGGGDGWKKKEIEVRKFEKPQEKKIDTAKNKSGVEGKKESNQTCGKEVQGQDAAKEDRIKEEEKSGQTESSDGKAGCVKSQTDSHSRRSTPDPKEDYDGRGDNTDPDDKKRKRKDRPERQIYIPRKALERQRQGSPHTGETPKDKPKETS